MLGWDYFCEPAEGITLSYSFPWRTGADWEVKGQEKSPLGKNENSGRIAATVRSGDARVASKTGWTHSWKCWEGSTAISLDGSGATSEGHLLGG